LRLLARIRRSEEEVEVTYVSAASEESEDKKSKEKEGEPDTKATCEECNRNPVPGQKLCEKHGGKALDPKDTSTGDNTLNKEQEALPAGRKLKEFTGSQKQMYSDIYWQLDGLGKEHFRRHMYCEVYDVDVDVDYVIYRCREEGDEYVVRRRAHQRHQEIERHPNQHQTEHLAHGHHPQARTR